MSLSFPLVHQTISRAPEGLDQLGERLVESVRQQEESIFSDIKEALDPSSPLMSLPKELRDQFKAWDQYFTKPEEIAAIRRIQKNIIEMHRDNRDFIQSKVKSNGERIRLELSIKAISKTMAGIQQLLSAQ